MEKKVPKKRRRDQGGGADPSWERVKGWRQLEVGDDFLVGAQEYGFMGLEVLDPSEAGDFTLLDDKQKADNAADKSMTSSKKKLRQAAVIKDATKDEQTTIASDNRGYKEKRTAKVKLKKKKPEKVNPNEFKPTNEDTNVDTNVDMTAWEDYHLDRRILDGLAAQGFSSPTHIQAECIPAALRDRRDIVGAAQTGSGKTLAFGLPILHLLATQQPQQQSGDFVDNNISNNEEKSLKALILTPTRELAMQVCSHMQAIGKFCGVWVIPIVGGISTEKQERLLKKRPQVVVATPGRLWDLMKEGQEHVCNLQGVRFLVIDEADRMVQQGHYAELSAIISELEASTRVDGVQDPERGLQQTFIFSATLSLPSEMRRRLKKGGGGASGSATLESLMDKVPFRGKGRPKIVDLTSERKLADKITEAYISCPEKERDDALYFLLAAYPGRTVVFVNAISTVRRLAAVLKLLELPVYALHAGMQQRARLKALDRFKSNDNAILLATDVAARGLDIRDVKCVVHYQVPASVDVYVHRSGRTARAGAEGLVLSIVSPKESGRFQALLRSLASQTSSQTDTPGEVVEFPLDESLMPAVRERVRIALKLDALCRVEAKRRAGATWTAIHAKKLELELDSDEEGGGNIQSGGTFANEAEALELRNRLKGMLAEPLHPRISKKFFTGGATAGLTARQGPKETEESKSIVTTVNKAVELARRVVDSRKSNAKADESIEKKRPFKKLKSSKEPKSRAAALAAAVRQHLDKKAQSKKKRGGLVVVARHHGLSVGRETNGPDALGMLRSHLKKRTQQDS